VSTKRPTEIGTAYFPEPDVPSNGTVRGGGHGRNAGLLRGLPRRRRPTMIALAVAMAGAGVVVSAAVYQHASHQVAVIMVTAPVPVGAVVAPADLSTTNVTVASGIEVIPARQIDQVSGEIAAVTLRPSTLLAPSDLTAVQSPVSGEELIAAPIKPYGLPASGLQAGDHVLVVATPGQAGQDGSSSAAPSLNSPVPAVVDAVNNVPDADGFDVVDLLVTDGSSVPVARQISTGQFALIVTKRG
jgi:hypothetical protein